MMTQNEQDPLFPGQQEVPTEDTAIVRQVHENYVVIEMQRTASCDHCGMSGFCLKPGAAPTHKVETKLRLAPGDRVRVHVASSVRILSSIILFGLPIVLMFIGYVLGAYALDGGEKFGILVGMAGLFISAILIRRIDQKMAAAIHIQIIEKLGNS